MWVELELLDGTSQSRGMTTPGVCGKSGGCTPAGPGGKHGVTGPITAVSSSQRVPKMVRNSRWKKIEKDVQATCGQGPSWSTQSLSGTCCKHGGGNEQEEMDWAGGHCFPINGIAQMGFTENFQTTCHTRGIENIRATWDY